MKEKGSSFSGSIGFVLAAAGSAVGVGNIWRFPYLCAKDGGGLFLLVYLVLVLTFGFVLLTTDVALGRKTKKNALRAFESLDPKWKFLGHLTFMVPALIMTYYSVIGGWIVKYFFTYIISDGKDAASDVYFTSFITSDIAPVVFMLIFLALTAWIVFRGVEKGIEKFSRIIMPGLILLIVIIAIFSLTLSHTDTDGTVRTGMQGLAVYLKPDFHGLTVKRFLEILLDAMSQLFFSLSVSMGIMITYGSYVKNEVNLNKATNQIEIFDTGVAFLSGLMIIPAVFAFSGGDPDTLQAGPALMFITIPKVFASMGLGTPIGILFFVLVLCAALTSSIALTESAVSTFQDELRWHRKKATVIVGVIMILLGTLSSLGYGPLGFVKIIGMQFLDFFDFLTNSVMMPIAALATCLLISRKVGVEKIEEEVVAEGGTFRRKKIFNFMIKYLCPIFAAIILLSSVANAFGLISM
jgi:NSS family neurotransmitter:Na+ symporter